MKDIRRPAIRFLGLRVLRERNFLVLRVWGFFGFGGIDGSFGG